MPCCAWIIGLVLICTSWNSKPFFTINSMDLFCDIKPKHRAFSKVSLCPFPIYYYRGGERMYMKWWLQAPLWKPKWSWIP